MEASVNDLSDGGSPRCGVCGDVIGVYEPLVCVLEESVRHTSRAAEPLHRRPGERLYHRACYASLDQGL
jgi:hypothetical protein